MKRLAIAAVGVALVVGIVVGGMVGNPFGRSARASAAGQAREDQLDIGAAGSFAPGPDWSFSQGEPPIPWIALDPANYPSSSAFRLELVLYDGVNGTSCFRLFDLTANTAVDGSELCETNGSSATTRLRSGAFALPSGEHEFTLQGEYEGQSAVSVILSRIIVDWTESPYAVGGIAELPPLASAPGGSGMGGATYAVLAGAAAGGRGP